MTVLDKLPHLLLTDHFQVPPRIFPLKKNKTKTPTNRSMGIQILFEGVGGSLGSCVHMAPGSQKTDRQYTSKGEV